MAEIAQAETTKERPSLAERLAANADGILEQIAAEYGVSTLDVVRALSEGHRTLIDGARFADVMTAIGDWGPILFIVHTRHIVLECEGSLPVGSFGHGYYNIHGDSPIGGHIKAGNCTAIYVVDRAFHGRRSCSVQFFNGAGEAMFKVFVRRDAARELLPDQLERFEALKAKFV